MLGGQIEPSPFEVWPLTKHRLRDSSAQIAAGLHRKRLLFCFGTSTA